MAAAGWFKNRERKTGRGRRAGVEGWKKCVSVKENDRERERERDEEEGWHGQKEDWVGFRLIKYVPVFVQ